MLILVQSVYRADGKIMKLHVTAVDNLQAGGAQSLRESGFVPGDMNVVEPPVQRFLSQPYHAGEVGYEIGRASCRERGYGLV